MSAKLKTHEHRIEDFAITRLAEAGHVCLKFVSPGFPGTPDRLILTNDGRQLFVEFKAPGRKLRRTQPAVIKMLRDMGHRVEIIDTFEQVRQLMKELNT